MVNNVNCLSLSDDAKVHTIWHPTMGVPHVGATLKYKKRQLVTIPANG